MGAKKKPLVVLTDDVNAIRKLCKLVNGCWVPPVSGRIACRAHGDDRPVAELPTISAHRWVWTVAHGFTCDPGPLVHVRRSCSTKRCCNPDHLFVTTSDGVQLSKSDFNRHMKELEATPSRQAAAPSDSDVPVVQDLSEFKALCSIEKNGCWIPRRSGRVAVRLAGDRHIDSDLPVQALHRVAYMLANGHTRLLQGNEHVRRRCGTKRCSNPSHLYLRCVDDQAIPAVRDQPSSGRSSVAEKTSNGLVIVGQHRDEVRALCLVSASGCWLPNVSSQCACLLDNSTSPPDALPHMALHRWSWLVANSYASRPLPGDRVHIRRTCKTRRCCNPDHLYAASPEGRVLSVKDILEVQDAASASAQQRRPDPDRESSPDSESDVDAYLRSVLMF